MRFIDKNSINHKTLNDMNANKNQYDMSKIINKYSNMKLKTEPTELQKYYKFNLGRY